MVCLGLAWSGCSNMALNRARTSMYAGYPDRAEESLTEAKIPQRDQALFLMELGTIRQVKGDYEASNRDYIEAYEHLRALETYSISKGTGSLILNDTVQDFVGAPFERALLHAMTAQNHFALGHWDDAAVEARRIISVLSTEYRKEYPEEPFSRYIAGLALQLIDDPSNAAMQYRAANDVLSSTHIDPDTGRLSFADTNAVPQTEAWPAELVVILQLGRSPRGGDLGSSWGYDRASAFAEIQVDGKTLGRSYPLSDTGYLKYTTDQILALRRAAKTATRIVLKESIAVAIESNSNGPAGDLTRLILIGLLEQPDLRCWETLPRWFQVARVPCPPELTQYDVVLKNSRGQTVSTYTVKEPIQRRGRTYVSLFRDLPRPAAPPDATPSLDPPVKLE